MAVGMAYDVAVIGNGPFGAAAGRHLAEAGLRVAIIGLSEPTRPSRDRSIYASHYDQARLLRVFDQRDGWAEATLASVDQYRLLEARTDIRFYFPTGALVVGPGLSAEVPDDLDIDHRFYPGGDLGWKARFPELDFPADHDVVHERSPAGQLNPRALIAAQNRVAVDAGALVVAAEVTGVDYRSDGVRVSLRDADDIVADQVVVATGAFTNLTGVVPEPLPLTIENEVYALGRVAPQVGLALTDYPTVKYHIDDPEISDIYMVAPVQYPDGNWYIKAGANTVSDAFYTSLDQVRDWFVDGDFGRHQPAFANALAAMWPGVEFSAVTTHPCILCRTPSGRPMIERVTDRLVVAVGGNGAGVKGSDHWGAQAAALI